VRSVGGWRLEGCTTGLEAGRAWTVRYAILIDARGRTREARVECRHEGGSAAVTLEGDGRGGWLVDGAVAPVLDGCLDVDLEASACTNAFPVRRLALGTGERAAAPAAWVRSPDLGVERLEQTYERLADQDGRMRVRYTAPDLGFAATLAVDAEGLVLDYPGIAARVA
jgi:uncharacterized protein